MGRSSNLRYGDTAIIFHWLIAFFIIGLLAIGKYMTGLAENDPVRFQLTQWHKSFGIAVLLLSVLRLLWRFSHRPPPEPATLPTWQKHVSGLVHLSLYALMFALPITGWIMVSASPLNIDTVLFGVIPWPHIPPFPDLPNKESIATAFRDYHEIAGSALIVLLLAHVGAALKHHYFDKDTILLRMRPNWASAAFKTSMALVLALLISAAGTLFWLNTSRSSAPVLAAGESEVSFVADVTGEATAGIFASSSVVATLDENNPANSTISATVTTASITSKNYQVAGSLPDADWLDVKNHPEALFQSTSIEAGANGELLVTGDLTMKTVTQPVTFSLILTTENERRIARGSFPIDRRDFSMGLESHATAEYVGFEVQIKFRFEILESDE
ncbi:MAG: cytochrome b561/polyisoprenoid-binding protein YceI [Granulosicoccus sp.]|jgi:cytochrome b561/polyisoprenoid-binding protein YceI